MNSRGSEVNFVGFGRCDRKFGDRALTFGCVGRSSNDNEAVFVPIDDDFVTGFHLFCLYEYVLHRNHLLETGNNRWVDQFTLEQS